MSRLSVVVPIGPNCKIDFVEDTLASVNHFCPDARVILLDDSGRGTGETLATRHGHESVEMSSNGLAGGLFATLSVGFKIALEEPFDVLLRLDTDALVIGSSFVDAAAALFSAEPSVAALGSHRVAYSGARRSFRQTKLKLLREASLGSLRERELARMLRHLIRRARKNGYELGESVMGGVTIYSRAGLESLHSAGLLEPTVMSRSTLQEDHLFALCLFAEGYRLKDFGTSADDLPMGVKHRGLPASPHELANRGKCLVHSTKFYGDMDEGAIRGEFAALRQGSRAQ